MSKNRAKKKLDHKENYMVVNYDKTTLGLKDKHLTFVKINKKGIEQGRYYIWFDDVEVEGKINNGKQRK